MAWGQAQLTPAAPLPQAQQAPPGDGFDPDGVLAAHRSLAAVTGPRLDVWRATTDNDRGLVGPLDPKWRKAGLHRMTHRTVDQERSDAAFVLHTRVAAGGIGRRVGRHLPMER